jgi:sugar lactone lactonase YvrE
MCLQDAARGLLRWVDILPGHVHALDPSAGAHTWFDAGDPVGTAGLTRGGGLVLALVDGFALADLREQPHGGDIFACTPGVTGRPPYLFDA